MKWLVWIFIAVPLYGQTIRPSKVVTPNINNILYVGVAPYLPDSGGIQAALTQAQTNGGGMVILPAGTISMSAGVTLTSNVCLIGAGRNATILSFTTLISAIQLGVGTQYACVRDIGLAFSGAAQGSSGIRGTGSDANLIQYNDFENISMTYPATANNGSTGAGIFLDSTGANTDVVLNTFRNIVVSNANQFAQCNGCEGNFWSQVQGFQIGQNAGAIMFQENGLNADEIVDARMESGSSSSINTVCYSATGSNNIVRLTCDAGAAGVTAVLDTGGSNTFDVATIGTPTLGTIPVTSLYRYVNSATGGNVIGVGKIKVNSLLLSNVTPTISSGFGTSPSIVQQNGTAVFEVNVGTGGSATSGVIGLPTATNGWSCTAVDMNTNIVTRETAFTATSVTLTAASAWTASDKLLVNCGAF